MLSDRTPLEWLEFGAYLSMLVLVVAVGWALSRALWKAHFPGWIGRIPHFGTNLSMLAFQIAEGLGWVWSWYILIAAPVTWTFAVLVLGFVRWPIRSISETFR